MFKVEERQGIIEMETLSEEFIREMEDALFWEECQRYWKDKE